LVGLGEFESPTSSMSTMRSNQLSYSPRKSRARIIRILCLDFKLFFHVLRFLAAHQLALKLVQLVSVSAGLLKLQILRRFVHGIFSLVDEFSELFAV